MSNNNNNIIHNIFDLNNNANNNTKPVSNINYDSSDFTKIASNQNEINKKTPLRLDAKNFSPLKIDINEDFFSNNLLPSLWKVIISSIQIKHVPLLSLLFAFNIGLKKNTLNQEQYHIFSNLFISQGDFINWKNLKHSKSQEENLFNAQNVSTMESKIAEFNQSNNPMFDEFFKIIRNKLEFASN